MSRYTKRDKYGHAYTNETIYDTEICFSELDVANIIDRIAKEMLEGVDNE